MKFTKDWFLLNGWKKTAPFNELIQTAESLLLKLGSEKYVEKQLRRDHSQWLETFELKQNPPALREAISTSCPEEEKNLTKVRQKMKQILSCPVVLDGAIMPDACPAGGEFAALPVGGIVVTQNEVLPSAHSMDICCSLYATFYQSDLSIEEELDSLQQVTRFGPGVRAESITDDKIYGDIEDILNEEVWSNPFLKGLEKKAKYHLADQGDGNHFAYLGEVTITNKLIEELIKSDSTAEQLRDFSNQTLKVLVTHHGSRGLGATVYTRGMDAALKQTRKKNPDLPEAACWLDLHSKEGQNYWDALQYVSRWTLTNHRAIHNAFIQQIESEQLWQIGNEHNFVWKHQGKVFHAKGATPAWNQDNGNGAGLLGLIPLNMAEPILLVRGSANSDYLEFAPHGAGRNLSRTALLKKFKTQGQFSATAAQKDIDQKTKHIAVRWYLGQPDVTESPVAYKNADSVTQQIEEYHLADILARITPRGCIMAGRQPKPSEKPLTPKQLRQQQQRKSRRKEKQQGWQDQFNSED
ncbi:RtcB family protein [Akkermansiaceae bacterium]|nr:RtcB family protein [Akkermansiaceae bacterium]